MGEHGGDTPKEIAENNEGLRHHKKESNPSPTVSSGRRECRGGTHILLLLMRLLGANGAVQAASFILIITASKCTEAAFHDQVKVSEIGQYSQWRLVLLSSNCATLQTPLGTGLGKSKP